MRGVSRQGTPSNRVPVGKRIPYGSKRSLQLVITSLLALALALAAAGEGEARSVRINDGALSFDRDEFLKWVEVGRARHRVVSPGYDDEEEDEVTFPDAEGNVDTSAAHGFVHARGGIVLSRGARSVRLSDPAYSKTPRGAVIGVRISGFCRHVAGRRRCLRSKRIELARLGALRHSLSGDETHFYLDARPRLTGFAAMALNTRLRSTFRGGQELGAFDVVGRLDDPD